MVIENKIVRARLRVPIFVYILLAVTLDRRDRLLCKVRIPMHRLVFFKRLHRGRHALFQRGAVKLCGQGGDLLVKTFASSGELHILFPPAAHSRFVLGLPCLVSLRLEIVKLFLQVGFSRVAVYIKGQQRLVVLFVGLVSILFSRCGDIGLHLGLLALFLVTLRNESGCIFATVLRSGNVLVQRIDLGIERFKALFTTVYGNLPLFGVSKRCPPFGLLLGSGLVEHLIVRVHDVLDRERTLVWLFLVRFQVVIEKVVGSLLRFFLILSGKLKVLCDVSILRIDKKIGDEALRVDVLRIASLLCGGGLLVLLPFEHLRVQVELKVRVLLIVGSFFLFLSRIILVRLGVHIVEHRTIREVVLVQVLVIRVVQVVLVDQILRHSPRLLTISIIGVEHIVILLIAPLGFILISYSGKHVLIERFDGILCIESGGVLLAPLFPTVEIVLIKLHGQVGTFITGLIRAI